jgi:hypothetical protein
MKRVKIPTDSGSGGEARETLQKLLGTSFSLHIQNGLHGGRKPCRNWSHLLGFSGLGPRSWDRSPKEVTLIPLMGGHMLLIMGIQS